MQPLLITARLVNGFVAGDPWSPTLDGLLAASLMRQRLGEEDFTLGALRPSAMSPVDGLPLERCAHADLWWYACSSPIHRRDALVERRWLHRRFDAAQAVDLLPTARRIATTAGPLKDYRISELRRVVPAVYWHAIGDAEEIARLLHGIEAIGAGRARGHGEVAEWTVVAGGEPALARHHRALPVAYADLHGIVGARMLAGIRPPARLPCNVVECVVPS